MSPNSFIFTLSISHCGLYGMHERNITSELLDCRAPMGILHLFGLYQLPNIIIAITVQR